jgi:PAS domain S-box-containing protein
MAMNALPAMLPGWGMAAHQVAAVFPFHFVLDADLRVVQYGRSLPLVLPGIHVGASIADVLRLLRPQGGWSLDALRRNAHLVHVLEFPAAGLLLRGQMVALDSAPHAIAFLGSPWLDGPESLDRFGLRITDLALHDPTQDLLAAVQLHRIANEDLRRLAGVLTDQRAELRRVNEELREHNDALQRRELELEQAQVQALHAHDALVRRTGELDAILDLSADGFLAFDERGAFLYANSALGELIGLAARDLSGLDEQGFCELFASLLANRSGVPRCTELADGATDLVRLARPRTCVLRRSARVMRALEGRPRGRVLYFHDVTREAELDRMKSEFLATASHELRTPMASVHGFSELLLTHDWDPGTVREIGATIHEQSALVVRMVNELLDLERIAACAGRDFEVRDGPVLPVIRRAVEGFRPLDDPRVAEVVATDGAACAQFDTDKLTQALTNVLSNAFKYSRAEGGPVRVSLVSAEGEVGIAVADSGRGMTPDEASRVFDRFYRADPSGEVTGTGLGMALVREIIQAMGGRVDLRSRPGEGTTVTLWLRAAVG